MSSYRRGSWCKSCWTNSRICCITRSNSFTWKSADFQRFSNFVQQILQMAIKTFILQRLRFVWGIEKVNLKLQSHILLCRSKDQFIVAHAIRHWSFRVDVHSPNINKSAEFDGRVLFFLKMPCNAGCCHFVTLSVSNHNTTFTYYMGSVTCVSQIVDGFACVCN